MARAHNISRVNKRTQRRRSGTHVVDLERQTCNHEEHKLCLKCGAAEFFVGLATGMVVTAIVLMI